MKPQVLLTQYGQFLFRYRRTVFPLIVGPLILFLAPGLLERSPILENGLDVLGVVFVLAGLCTRAAVIGLQYIERGGRDGKVYASRLVTGGIFSVCRNPLYVGNLLLLGGPVLISANPWVAAVSIPMAMFGYYAIVVAEEAFLTRKFGDEFNRYCHDVNRWWPTLSRIPKAFADSRFNWARVVIRDYNTMYLWSTITLIVLLREHLWTNDTPSIDATEVTCAVIFVALTLAYVTARVLKKRNLLTPKGWGRRLRQP